MPNGRSPFDLENPVSLALGSNQMGPAGSYIYREYWQKNMLPPDSIDVSPLDIWYKSLFWGRVDETGTVIYPSESFLKQVPGALPGQTHWAVDFVTDAYADLQTHMQRALAKGLISLESNITDLRPERSWVSVHKSYGAYMENVYETNKKWEERIDIFHQKDATRVRSYRFEVVNETNEV